MNWNEQRQNLIVEKMKLDKFFSMFLEKFERKMDPDNTNTPIWNLYKSKLKEYDKLNHGIRTAEYWITKNV
jgi:hypothetical protein